MDRRICNRCNKEYRPNTILNLCPVCYQVAKPIRHPSDRSYEFTVPPTSEELFEDLLNLLNGQPNKYSIRQLRKAFPKIIEDYLRKSNLEYNHERQMRRRYSANDTERR